MAKKQEKKPLPIKQSEGTRKSATDFGEASKGASRIRKAFAPLVKDYGEDGLVNRLNRIMIVALKIAGGRTFGDAYLRFLCGFRFNPSQQVGNLWPPLPVIKLDQEGLTIQVSKFQPPRIKQATHSVFQLMVASLDLAGDADEVIKAKKLTVEMDRELEPLKLRIPLNLSGDRALFIAVGIHHFNGHAILTDIRSFACDIVYAERIKDGHIIDLKIEDNTPPTDDDHLEDDGVDWEPV